MYWRNPILHASLKDFSFRWVPLIQSGFLWFLSLSFFLSGGGFKYFLIFKPGGKWSNLTKRLQNSHLWLNRLVCSQVHTSLVVGDDPILVISLYSLGLKLVLYKSQWNPTNHQSWTWTEPSLKTSVAHVAEYRLEDVFPFGTRSWWA